MIKLYIKKPYLIWEDIKWWIDKKIDTLHDYLIRKLYNRENKHYFDKFIKGSYEFIIPSDKIKYSVFSPVIVVMHEIEQQFGIMSSIYNFNTTRRLGIMGIDVDTQDENLITVNIRLRRPGLLIGTGGKDINKLQDRLEYLFNRPVKINIDEVRKDINEPIIIDY